jgi:TIR domain
LRGQKWSTADQGSPHVSRQPNGAPSEGDLIGDLDAFCREIGLERLRESLDRNFETEREEEVFLTRERDDIEFKRPSAAQAIRRYQALKTELLVLLATHHVRGVQQVPKAILLEDLCDDPQQVDRALIELGALNLLQDLNHSDGMRLTAEGQKLAEASLMADEQVAVHQRSGSLRFDFFISYASEDRDLAETLDVTLSQHGYKVWRDRGQLTLGDSLTEKINEGLTAARYAIVILSQAFLRKNWPRAELNALQARAIAEGQKIILPVRRKLDHGEMARHFPLLGDKLTVAFDDNLEELVSDNGPDKNQAAIAP